jgi:hypothetical protein
MGHITATLCHYAESFTYIIVVDLGVSAVLYMTVWETVAAVRPSIDSTIVNLYVAGITGRIEVVTVLLIGNFVFGYKEPIKQYRVDGQFRRVPIMMVSHLKLTVGYICHVVGNTGVGGKPLICQRVYIIPIVTAEPVSTDNGEIAEIDKAVAGKVRRWTISKGKTACKYKLHEANTNE